MAGTCSVSAICHSLIVPMRELISREMEESSQVHLREEANQAQGYSYLPLLNSLLEEFQYGARRQRLKQWNQSLPVDTDTYI